MTSKEIDFKTPGLAIFDKDWTLVKPTTEGIYVEAPWQQHYLSNDLWLAVDAIANMGWTIAVVSNQMGIEAGYKSLEWTFLEFRYLHELYPAISYSYFCPNAGSECWTISGKCTPEDQILVVPNPQLSLTDKITSFRKPAPGMLQLAMEGYQGLDKDTQVFYVGDLPCDKEAAIAAEIPFFWVAEFPETLLAQIQKPAK